MGGTESVTKDDFDANKYFRDQFKENLGATKINMYLTIKMMMIEGYVQKEQPYEYDFLKPPNTLGCDLIDPKNIMRNLNDANWAYKIQYSERVVKFYINDLDNLRIAQRLKNIAEKKEKDWMIYLPLSELTLNLKNKEAYFDKFQSKNFEMIRSEDNKKHRNWNSKRFLDTKILFQEAPQKYKFKNANWMKKTGDDEEVKEPEPVKDKRIKAEDIMIGYRWSIQVKGDVSVLPSINEIFYGLFYYISNMLEVKLKEQHQKAIWIEACKDRYKKVFDYILDLMDFTESDRPLQLYELKNPTSKATCLLLYIYSMETPFSSELNNSWKSSDASKVTTFGPFERAIIEILQGAEHNRRDRLDSCSIVSCSQSFLLYKGASMLMPDIIDWSRAVGKKALLPGNTGFYEHLRMALCATKSRSSQYKPVLFVLNVFNEINYPGFRLNNEKYSAYPDEKEVLLPGGEPLEVEWVDGMENDKPFEPRNMLFERGQPNLNGLRMYIVYLVRFG